MGKLHTFVQRQVRACFVGLKNWIRAEIKSTAAQIRKTTIAIVSFLILLLVLSISFSPSVREFCASHNGIVIVVLSVAGEVWADWNRKKTLRERLKKVCGIALVSGLILEIGEAIKADREVAVLHGRATSNELQVAELTTTNLVLRSNVLALEERANDRTIKASQRESILQCFVPAPTRGDVFVTADTFDGEAKRFAHEIRIVLGELHFSVKPYEYSASDNRGAIIQSIGEKGVFVIVKDWERPPSWTGAIVNCFTNAGIVCAGMETSRIWCPSNAIVVWVGQKP